MAYATINKPTDYFNTVLYTGNGGTNAITGVGFSPNFVWIKERNSTSSHSVSDTIRGTTKRLNPDLTAAEETLSGVMTSFDSDGFTNGADNGVNESGKTYVAWNWLAGVDAGSSNTDGSITSSVSANTTAGFSIVSYTGTGSTATVGHGLGVQPDLIILKARDRSDNWWVYHKGLSAPSTKAILLNSTNAEFTPGTSAFNTSTFSSSVFGILTDGASNASGEDYIAYCMNEKKGYSKFGSYTGNGSTNGIFIYTGFKPAFVITKRTDTNGDWLLWDNKRPGHNETSLYLLSNSSNAELTDGGIDIVSNGFKARKSGASLNASGGSYIYMAFAEQTLVGTNNIPATAV